jgi:arabinogalactan endo-1,4-beta-galactosidase
MKDFDSMSLTKLFWIPAVSCLLFLQPTEMRAQFANGADIGWLSQFEKQGYIFKDLSGNQKNCMEILKGLGINALRFRVWVDPSGGYCGKKDVAYMAHRADSMGFKVMLDFHCSDTWADPGDQTKPAAWADDSFPQLLTDLYNHVYGVLDTLKSLGVIPAWVQIGNETNDGMLWPEGRATTHMSNFAALIKSGYSAVKAVDSSIQVIVHLSNGNDNTLYRWMFDGLKSNGAQWDIIGMSVYPYWVNLPWATDDSLVLINMTDMITRYQKKIMVSETGYLANQPATADHFLLDLITKTTSVGGLGVFYWEPESYNNGYQLGAWNPVTEEPTAALDAFLGIYVTSVTEGKNIPHYDFEIYPNPFNPNTTIEYIISASSHTSIVIYDLLGREVATLVDNFKNAGNYNVHWMANNVPSGVYFCRIESGNFFETKKIVLLK